MPRSRRLEAWTRAVNTARWHRGGLLALLLLAACTPLPRPFADTAKTAEAARAFASGAAAGVLVEPVAGVPDAVAASLPERIAAALRRREVIATAAAGSRANLLLEGRVEAADTIGRSRPLTTDWRLIDPLGRVAGSFRLDEHAPTLAWQSGDPALLDRLAERVAAAVTAALYPAQPAGGVAGRPIRLVAVTGAPGDGDAALGTAMRGALSAGGFRLAGTEAADAVLLSAQVDVGPPAAGRQPVRIVWIARDATGAEIGRLSQANAVAAGSLDGAWGAIAEAVAGAAVPGLADLLAASAGRP